MNQWTSDVRARFFDEIPSGVVVVDKDLKVVDHNRAFGAIFGDCRGGHCFDATLRRTSACPDCPALKTFADGAPRVVERTSTDRDGREINLLVQLNPVLGEDGKAEYVAAIATDVTASKRLQREYQTLFENVPCFVAVINRDYRVVKANEAFRKVFGEPAGEHCYKLYKNRHDPCPDCPAERTFATADSHTSYHVGVSQQGEQTPYLVSTAPLIKGADGVTHVIEMALDMTEHQNLEEQLNRVNIMREALFENTSYGIVVFDEKRKVALANRSAEELFGVDRKDLIGRPASKSRIPDGVMSVIKGKSERVNFVEDTIDVGDEVIPARFSAVALNNHGNFMGSAVTIQDLRELRELERAMVEAERLAAVGQTVAGLAHGIKNILTGLEGGMYVTSTGLKMADDERIRVGWEMLERNMSRISSLTRNLLAFSRGDRPCPRMVAPSTVAHDVVGLFRDRAEQYGIKMIADIDDDLEAAPFDPEGMHSCLANLVSNAVDACLASDDQEILTITLSLSERDATIVYSVIDTGCGMDYEIKKKAFTSFFSTKGKGGSGLGLLLTRKIVQQHGGSIDVISKPGEGSTFRMEFKRKRLPEVDLQGVDS
jgi:histidine kinase